MAISVKYRDDGTGCRYCGEFHPDCSPCHQSPEDAALDRKQVLDAYRENMAEAAEPYAEHRGSRPGVDPTFADAAFRGFAPETPDQAEAYREKLKGFPEEMRPRIERHLGGRG